MATNLFFPIIDNGMGLSRTNWGMSLAAACLGVLRPYNITFASISYPYPDGAMNVATADFLESECEEMIVIDTDVVFSPEQLGLLLSHDLPLVFGLYPKKQPGLEFPVGGLDGDELPFANDGRGPLREVARCARGFMRVHRSVFEKMKPLVPTYVDAETGRDQWEFWKCLRGGHSEDFAFCDRWRQLGGKIIVDSRIACQHEGAVSYPIPGTF